MNQNLTILIAEDNADDILLLQRAFKKNGIRNPVHVCRDGEDIINYMKGIGEYKDRQKFPLPSIIFLDLKMPKKTGFEVLGWLKSHPNYSIIPAIVLTSSKQESDVTEAYKLGSNSYMVKPTDFEDLQKMIKIVLDF